MIQKNILFNVLTLILFFCVFISCNDNKTTHDLPANQANDDSLFSSKHSPAKNDTSKLFYPNGSITGDFNGDGKSEYAWLVPPKLDSSGFECIGECSSIIKFSDYLIPEIKVDRCINGEPVNLGDLNKDSRDEIGLLPGWFAGCWVNYKVFTLRNQKWINAVDPFPTHCQQWDEGLKPVIIDSAKAGNVIITYSVHMGVSIISKKKSIPVN